MKAVALSFTLKGQDEDKILKRIAECGEYYKNHILVHGFLPRKILKNKGIPTTIVDALDKAFPVQLNMWDGKPLREEMAKVAVKLEAEVAVIGEIMEGVKEEVDMYEALGLKIHQYPLEDYDADVAPESEWSHTEPGVDPNS